MNSEINKKTAERLEFGVRWIFNLFPQLRHLSILFVHHFSGFSFPILLPVLVRVFNTTCITGSYLRIFYGFIYMYRPIRFSMLFWRMSFVRMEKNGKSNAVMLYLCWKKMSN